MPTFRGDFTVSSSLVLPDGGKPMTIRNRDIVIVIRNAKKDAAGNIPSLNIQVVGEGSDLKSAAEELRGRLASQLDLLSFVTHSKFLIDQCWRVMDWEPFQKERQFRILKKFDPLYPPDPQLTAEFGATAEGFSNVEVEGYILRALRCFRYGILAEQLEEQFQQFWMSIETIAEGSKEATPAPIPCSKCGGVLTCNACHDTPTRVPMAQQAIRELIDRIAGNKARDVHRRLARARNHLVHGGAPSSIEGKIGVSLEALVNEAGYFAWHAIVATMPRIEQLFLGHRDGNFANKMLSMSPFGTFTHSGPEKHPTEDKLPEMNIEMTVTFRRPTL